MAIPFYSDVEFKNNIEQKGVFIHKNLYKNVLQFQTWKIVPKILIKTKINCTSQLMPYIHIYGYDYNNSDPIDIIVMFYIYNNSFYDVKYYSSCSKNRIPLTLVTYGTAPEEYVGIMLNMEQEVSHYMSFVIDCIESNIVDNDIQSYLNWTVDCYVTNENNTRGWYHSTVNNRGITVCHPENNQTLISEQENHPHITNTTLEAKGPLYPDSWAKNLNGYNAENCGTIGEFIKIKLNNTNQDNNNYIPFILNQATEDRIGYSGHLTFNPSDKALKVIDSSTGSVIGSTISTEGFTFERTFANKAEKTTINQNGFTIKIIESVGTKITETKIKPSGIDTHTIIAGQLDVGKYTVDSPTDTGQIKVKCIQGQGYSNWGDANGTQDYVLYRPDTGDSIIKDIDKRLTNLGFNEVSTSDNSNYMEKGTLKYNSVKIVTEGRFGEITIDYGTDDSNYQGHYIAAPTTEDKTITLKVSKPSSIPSKLNINKTISCYIRALAQGYNKDGTTNVPCVITTDDQHITISITFSKPSSQVGVIYRRVNGKVAFSWSNNIVL